MKNKRKAILLALISSLTIAGCSYREEHEIVEINEIKEEIKNEECPEGYINMNGYLLKVETTPTPTLEPTIIPTEEPVSIIEEDAYVLKDTIIYDNPNDTYGIYNLEKYERVHVTDYENNYAYITTADGVKGYVDRYNIEVLPNTYVEVDISDQNLRVVYEGNEVLTCDVVTGRPANPTDLGYTEILEKTYNRSLVGPTWNVPVSYFFPFNYDGEGFHDMTSRTAFGGNIYTYDGSHGCVNMSLEDVEKLDNYIEVGTKVLVHK